MAEAVSPAQRRHVLEQAGTPLGRAAEASAAGGIVLSRCAPVTRHILRLAPEAASRHGRILGFDISQPVNAARGHETLAGAAPRASLRLGPDEWLLIGELDPESDGAGLKLVDISHRNVAIEVAGAGVRDVLNTGVMLDLTDGAFPPGRATRTIFAKAEIILLRCDDVDGDARFRLECWRSFTRYLVDHIRQSSVLLGI